MPRLRGAQITGTLVGALLAAGCSRGDSSSADPGNCDADSAFVAGRHVLFTITNSLCVDPVLRRCLELPLHRRPGFTRPRRKVGVRSARAGGPV